MAGDIEVPRGGVADLFEKMRQIARQEAAAALRDALNNGGVSGDLTVYEGGFIRSEDWDGTSLADPGTRGWAFGGGAAAVAILNSLVLREGIIGNEALSTPVEIGTGSASQTGFAVGTVSAVVAPASIAIPPGYTKAIVLCLANAGIYNSTATGTYLTSLATINGTSGGGQPGYAGPGGPTWAMGSAIRTLNGLAGGTITLGARVRSQNVDVPGNSSAAANVDAIAIFRR